MGQPFQFLSDLRTACSGRSGTVQKADLAQKTLKMYVILPKFGCQTSAKDQRRGGESQQLCWFLYSGRRKVRIEVFLLV